MTNSEWTLHVFESKTRRRRGRRRWTHSVDIWPSGVTRHCMYIHLDRYSLSLCVCVYLCLYWSKCPVPIRGEETTLTIFVLSARATSTSNSHVTFLCAAQEPISMSMSSQRPPWHQPTPLPPTPFLTCPYPHLPSTTDIGS